MKVLYHCFLNIVHKLYNTMKILPLPEHISVASSSSTWFSLGAKFGTYAIKA